MKLTKKLEGEILNAYKEYWDAYLRGDLQKKSLWMHDNIQMFGSGKGEFFENKKKAIKYFKNTARQVSGKVDLRNRNITVHPVGDEILVNEECDFFVLVDSTWTFYGECRISTLFTKTNKGWKIIQEHASMPDARTSGKEQINTNKLKAENIQLKEAVQRRTIELEDKNRELRIEAALERVRARTMAMQKSDELPETTYLLFQQLKELGETAAQVSISIIKEEEGIAELSATVHGKTILQTYRVLLDEPFVMKKAVKAWKAKKRSLVVKIEGKELKDYNKWRNKILKKKIVFPEEKWIVHIAFFSKGMLSFSSDRQASKETLQLLEKFAGVFDGTYTRFLDLQKAEAQTREAEIELGLERVRAKATSMQHSNELADLVAVVFKELTHLGFPLTSSIIWIHDHASAVNTLWIASTEMNTPPQSYTIKPFYNDFFKSIIHAWKARDPQWIFTLDGKRKKEFEKAFFKELPELPLAFKKALMQPKQVVFSASFNNFGALEIVATEPLNEEKFEILHRFGKVFDLSYTRFNDLQKAEAQAREAQIEAGLERVRSRGMAMQTSEELGALIGTLFTELTKLDLVLTRCVVWIIDHKTNDAVWWMANSEDPTHPMNYSIPYHEQPPWLAFINEWKKRTLKWVYSLEGQTKKNWDKHLFSKTGLAKMPDFIKKGMKAPERILLSASFNNFGGMNVASLEPLSDEHFNILLRFAKVFDLTYTRFNDLKQAEAQAKESQIQLALERVRARTMAMQKSDELMETAVVLFEQLNKLGENIERTIIGIMNEEEGVVNVWATLPDGSQMEKMLKYPIDEPILMRKVYTAWKQLKKSIVIDLRGEELENYFQTLKSRGSRMKRESWGDRRVENFAFFSKGMLGVINADPNSPGNIELYKRFAAVFDLTYTRFLDLKNAEAQTREAQIQLSLERVRASAMAMHHSDELNEVLSVLFRQFDILDINPLFAHLSLFDFKKNLITVRITGKEGKRSVAQKTVPIDAMQEWKEELANWRASKPSSISRIYYPKEVVPQIWKLMGDLFDQLPDGSKIYPEDFPNGLYTIQGNVGFGYIGFNHTRDATEEEKNIVLRFATEFGRVYTRFLDLQKAEAQAREAEIELALERVRARAMAMHHSDELKEAAIVLYNELRSLDIGNLFNCGYVFIDEKNKLQHAWMTHFDGSIREAHTMPLTGDWVMNERYDKWKNKVKLFSQKVGGKKLRTHLKFVSRQNNSEPDKDSSLPQLPDPVFFYCGNFSDGYLHVLARKGLSKESELVLSRFTNVFEQTYKRFLDLQKSEAQTRESQIEAALERVRSKTMAMHNSQNVAETVATLFDELKRLGIETYRCGIGIMDETKPMELWTARPGLDGRPDLVIGQLNMNLHPLLRGALNGWKNKKEKFSYELRGDDLVQYYSMLNDHPVYPVKYDLTSLPPQLFHNDFYFNEGTLFVFSLEPLSAEASSILKRFATVFGQTYRRYLDLQKAEAQAREAQIELGLERVRARAMAMQRSDEVKELIATMSIELGKLDIVLDRCFIIIYDPQTLGSTWWMSNPETPTEPIGLPVQYHEHVPYLEHLEAWRQRKVKWEYILEGKVKKTWDQFLFVETGLSQLPLPVIENMRSKKKVYLSSSFNNFGYLTLATLDPLTDQQFDIMLRFAKVFDLTYTRFNDLKQAEAQAREAQIEAALERVRARAMAMQKSDELSDLVDTVFKELTKLDFALKWCIINIIDEPSLTNMVWAANPDINKAPESYHMKFEDYPFHHAMMKGYQERKTKYVYVIEGQEKKMYDEYLFNETEFRKVPAEAQAASRAMEKYVVTFTFSNFGGLQTVGDMQLSEASLDILSRFGKVFDLTYTRFNDLKLAEAQAREAQIEASLERVRARTMAMQKPQELDSVIKTVYAELKQLDVSFYRCFIMIFDEKKGATWWMGSPDDDLFHEGFYVQYHTHPPHLAYLKGWEERQQRWEYWLGGEIKKDWDEFIFNETKLSKLPPIAIQDMKSFDHACLAASFENFGCITTGGQQRLDEESYNILSRFAKVFDLTYTRFLDLQRAEAQAKEAQIETSLERVRSKTMAMHSSEDVSAATVTMFAELEKLGVENFRCGITNIKTDRTQEVWSVTNLAEGKTVKAVGSFEIDAHPFWQLMYKEWIDKKDFLYYYLEGKEKNDYVKILNNSPNYFLQPIKEFPDVHFHIYYFNEGAVWTNSLHPHSEEEKQIMKRFTSVFSLTFRRYQDLKKAEAQAREAQIEASLERVRAKAMAMHSSEDLSETIAVFYRELKSLSVTPRRCGVALMDKQTRLAELTTMNTTEEGDSIEAVGNIKMSGHPILDGVFENWLKQKEFHAVLRGNEIKEYYHVLRPQISFPDYPHDVVQYGYYFMFKEGDVYAWTESELPEEHLKIYRRFASVISLTYKRYLDLKQAEANAREAQIEAALEKVRGKAMAMHNSTDISATASIIFSEIQKLGITSSRCGVGLLSKNNRYARMYAATVSGENNSLSLIGEIELIGHPCYDNQYEAFLKGENYFGVLEKEELRSYYDAFRKKLPSLPLDVNKHAREYCYYLSFSEGLLYSWSEKPYSKDQINILNRFRSIIDLTFRRYIELQQSEANAREAVKQAALDRIRADIASMRSVADLNRITPLIWNELTILGIPFIRCGVFIMDNEQKIMYTFLSTPEGKAIAAFHLPYDITRNISQIVKHWQKKERYIDHWDKNAFIEFAHTLVQQGALASPEQYLATLPKGGFYLHFLPFLQGMLYVGNTTQLEKEEIELIQHVADAFSTAYARYEDFNKLEAAKKQVDSTLVELQATQKQLIQSEKMASLGELTAGIAHEIQNPLNFVNNFSEVSNELIEEMVDEVKKGNTQEAEAIANDLKQNLEKINHHGKRADAIVKSMLQHSRSSSGKKELTDINALADEYLRLSYHGLRAKDKTFNAKFETNCDSSIGKINVIPQDIGRVILNLINNAFYAVSEKKKHASTSSAADGYEPTVIVSTKNLGDKIEVSVKDNGGGIPQKVLDKIFQPFFTTKPTGQGTGLGLSLSYDIITKGHGGELKVETKEGEGSEFIIQLPGN